MQFFHLRLTILSVFFFSFMQLANAQVGALNKDFGNGGYLNIDINDSVYYNVLSTQGELHKDISGNTYATAIYNATTRVVLKFMPNGKLDPLFGKNGRLEIQPSLTEYFFGDNSLHYENLFINSDHEGNIYLAGRIDNIMSVSKYNTYGKTDFSFGVNGTLKIGFDALVITCFKKDIHNNFYISGNSKEQAYGYVAKFNTDGVFNPRFGLNGFISSFIQGYWFTNLTVDANENVLVCGKSGNMGALFKYDASGSLVPEFGNQGVLSLNLYWYASKIMFDHNNRIVFTHGNSTTTSVYRYLSSGDPDMSFNGDGKCEMILPGFAVVSALAFDIDAENNIYVVGSAGNNTSNTPNADRTNDKALIVKINAADGNFNASFGDEGILTYNVKDQNSILSNIVVNQDQSIYVIGKMNDNYFKNFIFVSSVNSSGNLHTNFADNGSLLIKKGTSYDAGHSILLDKTGNAYISGITRDSNSYDFFLAKLKPDGKYDETFGTAGKKILQAPGDFGNAYSIMTRDLSGNLYISTIISSLPGISSTVVIKTDKNGDIISSFGTNGAYYFTYKDTLAAPFNILFDKDSSLLICSNTSQSKSALLVTKLDRNGTLDLSYGDQGFVHVENNTSIIGQKVILDGMGNLYISGSSSTSLFITKITSQGLDLSFGVNGFYSSLPVNMFPACCGLAFDSDKNILCGAISYISFNPNISLFKITNSGDLVPEFGINGISTFSSASQFYLKDIFIDPDNTIYLFGAANSNNNTIGLCRTNPMGALDTDFGNNGFVTLATGGYGKFAYDKDRAITYMMGSALQGTDIKILSVRMNKGIVNTISGYVFRDEDISCTKSIVEKNLSNIIIHALPSNNYSMTDASGNYAIKVDTGNASYTIKQILNPIQQLSIEPSCTTEYTVLLQGVDHSITNINFVDKNATQPCPLLYIDVQSSMRRRCYSGYTKIKYANYGNASATAVVINITYPEYIVPKSSAPVWLTQKNKMLSYTIGSLLPNEEGHIIIQDSVVCFNENILGETQCIRAEILPIANCFTSQEWDQSDIFINQQCMNDSSVFSLKNVGTGNMDAPRNFSFFVNDTLIYTAPFFLEATDSLLINYPANGKTVRLTAEQHTAYPFPSEPSITVQSCVFQPESTPIQHTSITNLPLNDKAFHIAYSCLPVIGSFDPNHKSVTPSGYGEQNYITAKDKLSYTIQFQNVGTDTAFKVVVIDTLDADLNIETLLVESASHPFTYTLSGRGSAVLKFSFDPILLTDSTSNLAKSQGFVSYSIYPREDISEGTTISNKAYIYFDYNNPVITNETMLTIRNEYIEDLSKGHAVSVRTGVVTANTSRSNNAVLIYPNPAKDYLYIRTNQVNLKNIQIINLAGTILINETISGNNTMIKTNSLTPGIYFYLIADEFENTSQGKFIIE